MDLPILPRPKFGVRSKFLPKGKIDLQPFTIGLESIMLQVKDSKDDAERMGALESVISDCIATPNVTVSELPIFMIELIFLRLREKSIGEKQVMNFRCANEVKGEDGEQAPCNHLLEVTVDLREVDIVEDPEHKQVVSLVDDIGVKFKYPTLDIARDVAGQGEKALVVACIESIYKGDEVFVASDYTPEQLTAFYDSAPLLKKQDIYKTFLGKMPHLHYEQKFKCPKCGFDHEFKVNKLNELFA